MCVCVYAVSNPVLICGKGAALCRPPIVTPFGNFSTEPLRCLVIMNNALGCYMHFSSLSRIVLPFSLCLRERRGNE